ncbi:MAG: glycosyltransferase family 39 protein [Burkholderiales bacterium]|nr:glycosyltransferase family 39 protein [Burkholderiales bacterium]
MFALVWLCELGATSLAPPVDNIEQLVWQRELAWGYYKHPPLPTFLAWLAVRLLGASAWTTYLLGAAVTLGAVALLWGLLRELRGPAYATLALLAGLCITFYNGRLYYFNHNIPLLLEVAAAAACTWRAYRTRGLRWWAAFGAVMGLGALTKYQIAVTAASAAVFWLRQGIWRDALHRRGALLATLVALLLFTPHLLWLPRHDFGPITYAMESSLGVHLSPGARALDALRWLLDEVFNRALPALLLLLLAGWGAPAPAAPVAADARRRASRDLLFAWGLVPLAFIPLVGLAVGADLQLQWGTAFLLFLVPCVMEWAGAARWDEASLAAAWKPFLALQGLLLAINLATSPVGVRSLEDRHWRTFAADRLAERVGAASRALLGGPVRVVIGSVGEAGALALKLPEAPRVLVDGRYDRSPWVPRDLVASCGAVELAHADSGLKGWSPAGPPFTNLYWRVIPPRDHEEPCESEMTELARR